MRSTLPSSGSSHMESQGIQRCKQLDCYWGEISREEEMRLLRQGQNGCYLIRACISTPELVTVAVRCNNHTCRYRVTAAVALDIVMTKSICLNTDGIPLRLSEPITHLNVRAQRSSIRNGYLVLV